MKAERPRAKGAPTATGARPRGSLQRMVRRSVRNRRYSDCGSADLKDLDWERGWWTDNSFGAHYLHVWNKDGETVHRVFCRGHETPRLEMVRGKLMWLYTPNDLR